MFYCVVTQRVWVTFCVGFIFQHFTVKCVSIVRVYLSEEEEQTHLKIFTSRTKHFSTIFFPTINFLTA